MPVVAQPSFAAGELTPSLYGRVDLARFYTALKTCRNFIVRPYGGVMNRAGSEFCSAVKDHTKRVRLIEFIFSSTQAYVLEVGEQYIRFHVNGGILLGEDDNPLEVATPYLEDDLALLKYIQSADILTLCHRSFKQRQLSRFSNTSWTLTEFANTEGPFLDINIDKAITIYSSDVDGIVTLKASANLFTSDHVGRMLYLENMPDAFTPKWEVGKSITVDGLCRSGANYYQAVKSGTTGTSPPSILEGTEADGNLGVLWKYLHSGFGIVRISAIVSPTQATVDVLKRLPDSVSDDGSSIQTIQDMGVGTNNRLRIRRDAHGYVDGDVVTTEGVTGVRKGNGTYAIDSIDSNYFELLGTKAYGGDNITGSPLIYDGFDHHGTVRRSYSPTYKWAFEAWGGSQGYPAASIFYQQRQIFGGSAGRPHTIWMSTSGGFTNFSKSVPMVDDDAINFSLSAERANDIRHFIRMKELVALTSEAAWIIRKDQGNPIPLSDPQDEGGSSHVRPLKIGKKAIYVEDKGSAIRSLGYEFSSDTYEGTDLTLSAAHLFFGKQVVEWAYQKVPFHCVWIVLDDGSLVGLTYLPDQEVVAWHRHDTDGVFESVCCIPEGKEDAVYVVVRREIGGVTKRFIERFRSRFYTEIEDAFFVDCGLTYDGRAAGAGISFTLSDGTTWEYDETLTFETTTNFFTGESDVGDAIILFETATGEAVRLQIMEYVSTTEVKVLASRTVPEEFREIETTGFQVARNTFTGLGHLEGKTVSVLADGNVEPQKAVVDGGFSLDNPAVVVHAGLPITADFETLDVNVQGQSLQDKVKNVRSVTLIVEKTRGLQAGPDANNLLDLPISMSGAYDTPVAEATGPVKANIKSTWSDGGRVLVRQSDPLPATILAALPEVQVGGA